MILYSDIVVDFNVHTVYIICFQDLWMFIHRLRLHEVSVQAHVFEA